MSDGKQSNIIRNVISAVSDKMNFVMYYNRGSILVKTIRENVMGYFAGKTEHIIIVYNFI